MLHKAETFDRTDRALTTAIIRNPIAVSPEITVKEAVALMGKARSQCEANATAQSASNYMQVEARASCVVVVESHRIIGIITEQDVVRLWPQQQLFDEIPVRQVMTSTVLTLRESALTDLFSVVDLLQQNSIRHLPVVDEQDRLVGLVTHETLWQVLHPVTNAHQRLQLEQVITNVVAAIRASLHLQTILDTAVVQIRQAMNCDRVNIWQLEPDLSTRVVAEATLSTPSLLGEQVQDVCYQSHILAVYREGYIRVVPDIYTTEMTACHRELLIRLQTRAKVLLPLFCGDRLWGLLNVSECQSPRDWQTDEINFLHTISTHLAIAIQQASTHDLLQAELQERQQVEAKLQASQQQYVKLAVLAPVGIFYTDAAGNCTYVNDRWCQIAGLTPDQARGMGWMQAVHSDDRDTVAIKWYEAAQAGRRFQLEYRFLRDDGTVTWVFGQSEQETDAQGNVMGYVGTITDISDRKFAETLLQLKNDLLAKVATQETLTETLNYVATTIEGMLEGAICSILLLDRNNQLHEGASPSLPTHYRRQIDGIQVGEGVGSCGTAVHRRETVIVADLANDPLWQNFRDLALASGLRACWSTPIVAFNQSILGTFAIYYHEVHSPRADEIAFVDSVVPIVMLAIQRYQSELERLLMAQALEELNAELEELNVELEERVTKRTEELEEREVRYRGLLEGAADAILIADLQGHILEANQKAEALLGYSLAKLSTLHFTQLHPTEELDRMTKVFTEMAQRECTHFLDIPCLRQDGTTVLVDITATIVDIGGEALVQGIFRDITDRKQIETALRESQQFLQTVLDTVPLAVFWKDRSGHYLGANQLFLQDASLSSSSELVGKTDFDLPWAPTEATAYQADDRTVMDTGEPKLGIIETQHQQDGSEIWLETNKLPLRNLAGEIMGVLGTYQDITARRHAELVLERQLAAIEAAVDGIAILQNECHLYLNSSHVKMFGYEQAEELIGKSWRVLYSPEVQAWFDRDVTPVLLESKSWQGEILATRKDGTTFPQQLSLTYAADNLLICVCQDISERARLDAERQQAEAALRESEQRYATLTQAAPVAIFRFDLEGDCLYVNERWSEMTGKPIAFAMGHRWLETIHPDDLEQTQSMLQQWFQSGAVTPFQHEARIFRDDGRIVWYYCQMIVEIDTDGQPVGYVGTLTDISDRKAAEMRLYQHANRETLLREITQRIRQSLDLNAILNTAVEQMRHMLNLDRVAVYRFLPDWSGDFIVESVEAHWVKLVNPEIQKVWEDTYLQENQGGRFQNHETFVIPDIYQADLQHCHIELLEQFQARAFAVVPIFVGESLWGLLAIYQNATSRQWLDWEIELLQQVASQLAIAIQQASLYDQVQSELLERHQAETKLALQLRQQQALAAITQLILQRSLDLAQILATVVHQVREVLNGDRVIIFRLYPDGTSRIVEEAVSAGLPCLRNQHWDDEVWSQDILNAYWQGQPRMVPDVMADRWTDCLVEYAIEGQIQSKIVAPILQEIRPDEAHRWVSPSASNKLWGVLVIHACTEKRVWLATEAQLLQQIANQVAIAIQQANLFEQLQQELTERQQAQRQLTERNQQLAVTNLELERATRLKDEFLANMSHELRTPLNAILGMTECLQEEIFGIVNEQQSKALGTVENSAAHLLALINDILDVAKIASGQVKLDCSPVAVEQLCASSLVFIKQQALKKRIRVETQIPSHLPALFVDEMRMRQVLLNLLTNAVKFTLEGGTVTLTVSLVLPEKDRPTYLRIAIADTGIGIAPENISRLFKPFVQIDGALNRQQTGTGLGLALVKQVVELHGGRVGLTSALGGGSCFTVDLPYRAYLTS